MGQTLNASVKIITHRRLMKNTLISDIRTYFALAAAVVAVCLHFTLGPARTRNLLRTGAGTGTGTEQHSAR